LAKSIVLKAEGSLLSFSGSGMRAGLRKVMSLSGSRIPRSLIAYQKERADF